MENVQVSPITLTTLMSHGVAGSALPQP